MDNQRHNSEDSWVNELLAALVPSGDCHPDSNRALAQFKKRQNRKEMRMETMTARSLPWVRFSMVAAVMMSIGLVVVLLPWSALWRGAEVRKSAKPEPLETAPMPVVPSPPVQPRNPTPAALPPVAEVQQEAAAEPASPVEHVGPGITPPRVIKFPEPVYSDDARLARIQGIVRLSVIFRTDGIAKVEKVIEGLGYGLDEKAIEACKKMTFTPGMKDGQPVDVQMDVTMNFHLY